MSTVVYNGIGLLRCQLLSYEREPVWQGPDYLWTVHRIRVRGVYNPEINAFTFPGQTPDTGGSAYQFPTGVLNLPANAIPVTNPVTGALRFAALTSASFFPPFPPAPLPLGPPTMNRTTFPVFTDLALKHKMMQPRGVFVCAAGNTPMVVAPTINAGPLLTATGAATAAGFAAQTDAHNGPVPLSCDVVQISGIKSFLVDFAVECYLNESYLYASTPSVLLSHRWERTETIDQDFYSTIITTGTARFRSDRILYSGTVPDDFRGYLFHPVPPRCQRVAVDVTASEDGTALAYRLVDKLTYLRYAVPGVTRIEAFQSVGGDPPDWRVRGISAAVNLGFQTPAARGFWGGLYNRAFGGTWVDAYIGSQQNHPAMAPIQQALTQATASITKFTLNVVARVWGNPLAVRSMLEAVALAVCGARVGAALAAAYPGQALRFAGLLGTGVSVTHDISGSFVEASINLVLPPPLRSFAPIDGAPAIVLPDVRLLTAGPANDSLTSASLGGIPLLARDFAAHNDLPDPLYFNAAGTGTRGGVVQRMAAAALNGQDAVPVGPPPVPANAFTPTQMAAVPLPP
jgi:hypothetical protein